MGKSARKTNIRQKWRSARIPVRVLLYNRNDEHETVFIDFLVVDEKVLGRDDLARDLDFVVRSGVYDRHAAHPAGAASRI